MKVSVIAVLIAGFLMTAAPVRAADKTHQQLMAEIRMLQEQQAQLQQMLGGLAETLKAMTAKMDEQTNATRKGFADQMLIINGISDGVRVLREKSDDTNVRLATMTQEIESMRQAVQSMPSAAASQPAMAGDPSSGVSPGKTWDAAFNDYTSGQYDLAIQGFEYYIKTFPSSARTDDAQLGIGNSYYAMGDYKGAEAAYQKVIAEYAESDSVAQAYYKLGLSYEGLKQPELARRAYETVMKNHPGIEATLAKQRLDSLNKKEN